jgi:hypothetical protein
MNIAIGVWTLVLGGVLIPGTDSFVAGPGMATRQEATMESGVPGGGLISPRLEAPPAGQGPGGIGRWRSAPVPYRETTQDYRRSAFQDSLIPFAPTDPSAASSAYPWGPPTAGSPPEEQFSLQPPLTGGPPTGPSGSQVSGSPGYGRPSATRPAYRGYSPYSSYASQMARIPASGLARGAAYPSAASGSKPYDDYRRPPSVSPYMQLGRTDSWYGDIDNYNQYVKPGLEQLNANQQVRSQIRGLQNSVRTLGRQTQSLRGIVIPQYYMNYGGYYPGFGR